MFTRALPPVWFTTICMLLLSAAPPGPIVRWETLDRLVLFPHTAPRLLPAMPIPWLREPTLADPTPLTAPKAEPVFVSCCRLPLVAEPPTAMWPPFKALVRSPLAPTYVLVWAPCRCELVGLVICESYFRPLPYRILMCELVWPTAYPGVVCSELPSR